MLTYRMDDRDGKKKGDFLYESIKQDILAGKLRSGEKLPSKRAFSEHLGVSVVTVEAAYGMLQDEGYVTPRDRSGFYVNSIFDAGSGRPGADRLLEPRSAWELRSEREPRSAWEPRSEREPRNAREPRSALEPRSEQGLQSEGEPRSEREQAKRSGENLAPAADFPYTPFLKIVRDVLNDYRDKLLMRPPNAGCPELREAVARHLIRFRGMDVRPEQVIIGSGSEYLYGLIAQLFRSTEGSQGDGSSGPDFRQQHEASDSGSQKNRPSGPSGANLGGLAAAPVFGLEQQSYEKIRLVYAAHGVRYELLPMDRYGISREGLEKTTATVLHVTPFHSYPTGITAPAAKRYEYIDWAARRSTAQGAWIIEDDFESEFSVPRKPLETLYSMDNGGRVIYLNTFTKSLAPSMRVGYMVLPERLLPLYQKKLGFYSCTVPSLDQYVLAEYINRGFFEKRLNHIRRKLRQGN